MPSRTSRSAMRPTRSQRITPARAAPPVTTRGRARRCGCGPGVAGARPPAWRRALARAWELRAAAISGRVRRARAGSCLWRTGWPTGRRRSAAEDGAPRVGRVAAELLLDAQELVVLGDAIGARRRARLDLTAARRDREVGDRDVLGLPRAVGHDGRVAGLTRRADRVERLRQRADLVDLDEDRVGDPGLDPAPQPLGVRHEEVVADELQALAEAIGEDLPAVPVLLVHAVLDRHDRVLAGEVGPVVGELRPAQRAALV